jgi:hypothetical protein
MVRRGQQVKLLEPVLFHLAQLGDDFVGSAYHTGCANRLGRYEAALIGLHEGAMAVVDLAEAGVLGQAVVLDPLKVSLPYLGEMRRDQRVVSAFFQPDLVEKMQLASHPRAGLDSFGLPRVFRCELHNCRVASHACKLGNTVAWPDPSCTAVCRLSNGFHADNGAFRLNWSAVNETSGVAKE